jgi:hypothetical protein
MLDQFPFAVALVAMLSPSQTPPPGWREPRDACGQELSCGCWSKAGEALNRRWDYGWGGPRLCRRGWPGPGWGVYYGGECWRWNGQWIWVC